MEHKPMTDDDYEKMLTEQRAQLEYALAVFDATAEFYLIPYKMAAMGSRGASTEGPEGGQRWVKNRSMSR